MNDLLLEMIGHRAFLTAYTKKGWKWVIANMPSKALVEAQLEPLPTSGQYEDGCQLHLEIDNAALFAIFIAAESSGLVVEPH